MDASWGDKVPANAAIAAADINETNRTNLADMLRSCDGFRLAYSDRVLESGTGYHRLTVQDTQKESMSRSEVRYPRIVSETTLPAEAIPQDIKRRIDAGEPLVLIDVREPEEYAITRIDGATLIPMRNIPASLQQLEAKADEATL